MGLVYFGDHHFDARLIAFDKDGTLFDFNASWRPKFLKAVDRLLAQISHSDVLRTVLCSTLGYNMATGVFGEHGPFATATSEAIIHAASTVLFQHTDPQLPWFICEQLVRQEFAPGLADSVDIVQVTDLAPLLASLHENGVKIALITSDDGGPTEAVLAHFGLTRFFDFIACGDSAFRAKPAPDALQSAAAQLGVPLSRTAVVGDSVTDLRMAHAAGAALRVGVLTGVGSRKSLATDADLILNSIAQIQVLPIPRDIHSPAPARSSGRPDEH